MMKTVRKISLFILIAFFLISGVSCTQNPAKNIYNKGIEYAIQGEFVKAKEEFERTLKTNPSYYKAKFSLEITNEVLTQKIKMEPAIHLFKGISHGNKRKFDLAIRDFNKAIEINPRYAFAYLYRGLAHVVKGQHKLAIRDFSKTIEIKPKFVRAYENRGFIYITKLENKVKGCADFKKACKLGKCKAYNFAKQKGDCP